jgi:hypothetical protein
MAGCWLLLKNPTNRQVLGNAFSTNPASSKLAQGMVEKLQATVDVADVNEAVSSMGFQHRSIAATTKGQFSSHLSAKGPQLLTFCNVMLSAG